MPEARLPTLWEKEEAKVTVCAIAEWCGSAKAQLWGLLVVASVDPRLGPEKGADGGELVKVESRQLDGIEGANAEALGSAVEGDGDEMGTPLDVRSSRGVGPRR
jgi:hypothetical protein